MKLCWDNIKIYFKLIRISNFCYIFANILLADHFYGHQSLGHHWRKGYAYVFLGQKGNSHTGSTDVFPGANRAYVYFLFLPAGSPPPLSVAPPGRANQMATSLFSPGRVK